MKEIITSWTQQMSLHSLILDRTKRWIAALRSPAPEQLIERALLAIIIKKIKKNKGIDIIALRDVSDVHYHAIKKDCLIITVS